MTNKSSPLLEIRNLQSEFLTSGHWNPVVRDISLSIHPNETLAVVGESGSGKSVTALSTMRLLPKGGARIGAGQILFEGEDLAQATEQRMRQLRGNRLAMIFQEPMTSLNPTMRAGIQVAESLRLHRKINATEARTEAIE